MVVTNIDYRQFRKELEEKGLLSRTPAFYISIFIVVCILIFLIFSLIFYFNKWYVTVPASVALAMVGMQLGFFGHDAGHYSIAKNRLLNDSIGHISHSFFLGLSFSYWRDNHNKHHSDPNHQDMDPDIRDSSPFSLTEKKAKHSRGITRFMTKHQAFLLLPAFLGLGFSKKYLSLKWLVQNKKLFSLDFLIFLLHLAFFFLIGPYFIGYLQAFLLYLIMSMVIGFYFGFVFITNHIGMTVLSGNEEMSYLEKQVVTSRDIKGSGFLDFMSGGLNYQIEHHLFPHLSRKHLPKIKPLVKEFCIKKGISYSDATLKDAWKEVFAYINEMGRHAKNLNVFKAVIDMG